LADTGANFPVNREQKTGKISAVNLEKLRKISRQVCRVIQNALLVIGINWIWVRPKVLLKKPFFGKTLTASIFNIFEIGYFYHREENIL